MSRSRCVHLSGCSPRPRLGPQQNRKREEADLNLAVELTPRRSLTGPLRLYVRLPRQVVRAVRRRVRHQRDQVHPRRLHHQRLPVLRDPQHQVAHPCASTLSCSRCSGRTLTVKARARSPSRSPRACRSARRARRSTSRAPSGTSSQVVSHASSAARVRRLVSLPASSRPRPAVRGKDGICRSGAAS